MKRRTPPDSPLVAKRKRSWIAHRVLMRLGFFPVAWASADDQIHVEQHEEVEPAFTVTSAASDEPEQVVTKDLSGTIAIIRKALAKEGV